MNRDFQNLSKTRAMKILSHLLEGGSVYISYRYHKHVDNDGIGSYFEEWNSVVDLEDLYRQSCHYLMCAGEPVHGWVEYEEEWDHEGSASVTCTDQPSDWAFLPDLIVLLENEFGSLTWKNSGHSGLSCLNMKEGFDSCNYRAFFLPSSLIDMLEPEEPGVRKERKRGKPKNWV